MGKLKHEVRDGLYGFIEFDEVEKRVIDSVPFQRLRDIHQLAMSFHVYPGATHRRFEHSLGVMESATRIFDTVFNTDTLAPAVQERIAAEMQQRPYWRRVLRLGALLHDVGHLPFSHAAEDALLPEGWNHERITAEIIRKSEIAEILKEAVPQINPEHVIDVCWDLKKRAKIEPGFAPGAWKMLLNEIITGNTFGADRMDYLLRDSWHAGVSYGKFDPHRLIAGLRATIGPDEEVALGLDGGAIHAAEALLLARYFMYTQVYFHDVRRSYDQHLKDFLQAWLPGGRFPTDWRKLVQISDNEVLSAMRKAAQKPANSLNTSARRICRREHFRTVYELTAVHKRKRPTILEDLSAYAAAEFGPDSIRFDAYTQKAESNSFWVITEGGTLENSLELSGVIARLPLLEIGFVFAAPTVKDQAAKAIRFKVSQLLNSQA